MNKAFIVFIKIQLSIRFSFDFETHTYTNTHIFHTDNRAIYVCLLNLVFSHAGGPERQSLNKGKKSHFVFQIRLRSFAGDLEWRQIGADHSLNAYLYLFAHILSIYTL